MFKSKWSLSNLFRRTSKAPVPVAPAIVAPVVKTFPVLPDDKPPVSEVKARTMKEVIKGVFEESAPADTEALTPLSQRKTAFITGTTVASVIALGALIGGGIYAYRKYSRNNRGNGNGKSPRPSKQLSKPRSKTLPGKPLESGKIKSSRRRTSSPTLRI